MRFKADLDGTVTGVRFYKATANTGTPHRQPVVGNGTLLATRDVHGRDGHRLAAADVHDAGRHHRGDDLRRVVLRAARALLDVVGVLLHAEPDGREHARTPRRCTRSAPTAVAPTASTPTGARRTFPNSTYNGENYAVDVVFTPKLPPGPVSNVSATAGPGSATVNFSAPVTGGPPTRYVVTPFIGSTAQPHGHGHGHPAGDVRQGQRPRRRARRTRSGCRPATGAASVRCRRRRTRSPQPRRPPRARRPALIPSAGNQQATLRWTAPNDGGAHDHALHDHAVSERRRAGRRPQVTGSPAPETAVVTGLTNGSSYTFTVTATNSVGTGPSLGRVERRHAERRAALHPARLRAHRPAGRPCS